MTRQSWIRKVAGRARRPVTTDSTSCNRQRRRGAAVVELAVTSPLLCLLILGVVEYAQFANTAQVIGNASRRGARFAARNETTSVAEVQTYVRDFVTGALSNLPNGSAVNVQVVDGAGASIAGGNLTTISNGSPVMVDVSLDFSSVRWINYFSNLNGQSLQAITIARRE